MSKAKSKTLFFEFAQNNSGGIFIFNEQVGYSTIVEADSAVEANLRAESVGVYFDGCKEGRDCPCCGDRWSRLHKGRRGTEVPSHYDKPLPGPSSLLGYWGGWIVVHPKKGKPYYFTPSKKHKTFAAAKKAANGK